MRLLDVEKKRGGPQAYGPMGYGHMAYGLWAMGLWPHGLWPMATGVLLHASWKAGHREFPSTLSAGPIASAGTWATWATAPWGHIITSSHHGLQASVPIIPHSPFPPTGIKAEPSWLIRYLCIVKLGATRRLHLGLCCHQECFPIATQRWKQNGAFTCWGTKGPRVSCAVA